MKQTLFELTTEMLEFRDILDNHDGDVTDPEVEKLFMDFLALGEQTQEAFEQKVDNYVWLIKELEKTGEVRKAEGKRLTDLAGRDSKQADWLKKCLENALRVLGHKKLKTKYHNVGIVGNGGKQPLRIYDGWGVVDTEDVKALPAEYLKTQPPMIDKDKIREELDSGAELPFAKLDERGERLSIK